MEEIDIEKYIENHKIIIKRVEFKCNSCGEWTESEKALFINEPTLCKVCKSG